jgi:uncharacterized membrane protein YgcG
VRRLVALLVTALLVTVGIVGTVTTAGAQSAPVPSSDSSDDDAVADPSLICDESEAPDPGQPVGTTQLAGDIEVTVTDTDFESTIDDFWDEGYLRADFTLRNLGDEPYDYDGYHDWSLLDATPGGIYPSTLDPTARINSLVIGPGEGIEGHVVFPVGHSAGTYRVQFERDGFWDSEDRVQWAVSVDAHSGPETVPTDAVEPTTEGFENLQAYDIDIVIHDDGSATFTETIDYDFDGLQRHGIYRDLTLRQRCSDRYDRVYPMSDVSVSSPTGAPAGFTIEDLPAGSRIKIGDADSTVSGEQTYVVTYTLDGTLNGFEDHDELYWNVIGEGWGVQLANIRVVVHAPGEVDQVACYAGETGSRAACDIAVIGRAGDGRFRQTVLSPYQQLTIVVGFPTGLVPPPQAILDERWALDRAFALTPVTVGGTAFLSLLLIVGYGVMAFAVGRDRRTVGSATDMAFASDAVGGSPVPLFDDPTSPVEFIPPDGIRPAQMALLLTERVRPVDVTATIIDLAARGYLRIEEVGEGRKKDYRIVRLRDDSTGLLDFEAKLFDALVPAAMGQVLLSDHKDSFASDLNEVMTDVYEDGMRAKWFRSRPDHARTKWRVIGFMLVIVTGVALALAIWLTHLALLAVPPLIFALLVFFGAGKMPARTPRGTGLTSRSRGFEIFLRDSEAPRARWAEQKNIFSEYLPYAIVLGCADRWAKTFEPLGAEALASAGAWYVGSDPTRPFGVNDFVTSSSSFASSASSTLTSTPASSGSSGFSGGGGGGSSGGGGGGGGGGSW